jgi:HEPN domain-containing protein
LSDTPKTYPGELATPEEVLRLASEYQNAAKCLLKLGRRGEPLSRAPFRLVAIHAVELYLSALLLHLGHSASEIRGLQHDLSERTKLATEEGLQLRKRTAAHLAKIVGNREYLIARYGPETVTVSQINQLEATLNEVAKIVTTMMTPSNRAKLSKAG